VRHHFGGTMKHSDFKTCEPCGVNNNFKIEWIIL